MTPRKTQPAQKYLFSSALVALCALAFFSSPAAGQTIVNPSFEADAVPPFPGYGPITGWAGGSGINDSAGPFNYNSTIPDGQKVAFIQSGGTMHQVVSGFTPGLQYVLRYYENARLPIGPSTTNLQVTVGGVTVVPTHEVLAVGQSNPYVQKTSAAFTANAATLDVAFITSGSGDFTVLLDKVEASRNLVVTNTADSGPGSLRQTVLDAPAGSTITFSNAGRGTISLTTGRIVIDKSLTIAGPGADLLTIRNAAGNGPQNNVIDVIFGVTAVLLSDLTISDGYAGGGGGIFNAGNLTVRNAVIRNNQTTGQGGGIESGGTLTLVNSTVTGNGELEGFQNGISRGGGIHFVGTSLTIIDSTVSFNKADEGGGIYVENGGSVSMTNSTIGENTAQKGFGGGLYLAEGIATLTKCTVSQNLALESGSSAGGGIFVRDASTLTLVNSTIANNLLGLYGGNHVVGAGIANVGATVNARNSIISGNTPNYANVDLDFDGTLTSQGYNLISTDEGMTVFNEMIIVGDTTGNIVGSLVAARLGPLADNGGPTKTHALLNGSPAINAGNTATSPATDQRGAARVGTADIGAFELNNSANGGSFVAQLPDGVNQTPYQYTVADFSVDNHDLNFQSNDDTFKYTYTVTGGALPTGILLYTTFSDPDDFRARENVKFSGTTAQSGVFNFSVTATNRRTGFSVVTDYRLVIGYRNPSPTSCKTFVNTASILIPAQGPASPYPSNIGVAGLGGTVTKVTVTLTNITHASPADISILLVGPSGERVLLMSNVGETGSSLGNATYTFDDAAAAGLPSIGFSPNGSYRPSNFGVGSPFPPPAPPADSNDPHYFNHGLLSAFNGTAPNGLWSLYVMDYRISRGGGGIYGGWSLSITTTDCPAPPAITSAANTTFVVGTAGTFTVAATGAPSPTLSQTGTLPNGVTFTSETGVLSGTPAAGTGGTYPLTFTASNGVGTGAVQNFTLTINQAPAITSVNTTTFTAGTAGNFNVLATGFPPPAINLTSGTVPTGVNYGNGTLAGMPTAFGTFPLTFTASNGVGSNAVQNFSLVVNPSAQDIRGKAQIQANPGGGYRASFLGNPGQQYMVQFSPEMQPANWQFLSLQTAGADGNLFIIDNPPAGTTRRFYRALVRSGWTAQYYKDAGNGTHLIGAPLATRIDATINFSDSNGWAEKLVPGTGVDNFSVRWSGQFLAPATASYTFYTTSDDGVHFYLNAQTLIDNWTVHAPVTNSVTVTLNAGQFYPIVLEFFENVGGAVISLEYEAAGAGIPRQIVPADRVY